MGFKLSRGGNLQRWGGGRGIGQQKASFKSFSYFLPGQIYLFFPKKNPNPKNIFELHASIPNLCRQNFKMRVGGEGRLFNKYYPPNL